MLLRFKQTLGRLIYAAMAITAICALSACGSNGDGTLIEKVPDTATSVATINLDRLFREAGCPTPVADGRLKPEAAKVIELLPLSDMAKGAVSEVLTLGGFIDTEHILSFRDSKGKLIIVATVNDAKRLEASFVAAGFDDKEEKGFHTYKSADNTYAVNDNTLWIASSVEEIAKAELDSRSNHFGTLIGIRQFLDTKNEMNLAFNCGANGLRFIGDNSKWLCASVKVNERLIAINAEVMDRDGKLDSIGSRFGRIDPDFLRYVPGDAVIVGAVGKCDPALIGLLTSRLPFPIQNIDGTSGFYALPASNSPQALSRVDAWNVFGMIKMPQADIDNVINRFKIITGAKEENGQYRINNGSAPLYIGNFDGYLTMSLNREISSGYNNPFTQDFEGRRLAAIIDIPAGSPLLKTWGLPCGVNVKVSLETEKLFATIAFNGSTTNAFTTMLNVFPKLGEAMDLSL